MGRQPVGERRRRCAVAAAAPLTAPAASRDSAGPSAPGCWTLLRIKSLPRLLHHNKTRRLIWCHRDMIFLVLKVRTQTCGWIEMYHVPQQQWLATATLHLDGHAALWWQPGRRTNVVAAFCIEKSSLLQFLGVYMAKTSMINRSMTQLKQSGSAVDYRSVFEAATT